MNRRGTGISLGTIIILYFVMDAIGISFIIFPLIFGAIILSMLIPSIFGKKNSTSKNSSSSSYKQPNKTSVTKESKKSSLGNGDINKIDKKLEEYFKNNISLQITDDLALVTQSGKFTTVDQLFITYKEEKVMKLDEFKNTYFEMYEKIMKLLLVFAKKDVKVNTEIKPKEEKIDKKAINYIDKIDALNEAIPQEEITNGLYQTCDLLKQIEILKETHNDEKKTQKLYDYYLPILLDVLENYKKLQDAPVRSEEFKDCETQLIKTIVLINEALKAICASMQEDDYMSINADINTLQSLLEKDGYGENPFKGESK